MTLFEKAIEEAKEMALDNAAMRTNMNRIRETLQDYGAELNLDIIAMVHEAVNNHRPDKFRRLEARIQELLAECNRNYIRTLQQEKVLADRLLTIETHENLIRHLRDENAETNKQLSNLRVTVADREKRLQLIAGEAAFWAEHISTNTFPAWADRDAFLKAVPTDERENTSAKPSAPSQNEQQPQPAPGRSESDPEDCPF